MNDVLGLFLELLDLSLDLLLVVLLPLNVVFEL